MNWLKPLRPTPFILIAASVILFHQSSSRAATDTWTGNVSANWSDPGNWTGGNSPPLAGDILSFDGNSNATTNNDFAANTQFNGLNFLGTAGSFTLTGNAVLLGGDINDNSTNSQTITLGLLLDGATSNLNVAPGGSLSLGGLTYGLAAGSTNLSSLNVNQSVSAASVAVRTASTTANTLSIAGGQIFNITNGMTIGFDPINTAQSTRLNVSGQKLNVTGGTILIGANSTGSAGMTATLDLSGLTGFDFAGTELNLGGRQANTTGNRSIGNLTLANTTNNITVTTLNVGAGSNSNAGNNNNLNLGIGANTINANSIFVGTHKSTGNIQFAGPTGSLVIRDNSGTGRANITIGSHQSSGTVAAKGAFNFNGHSINILAGTLLVGQITSATTAATVADTVSFDTGTLDVTSITLGQKSSGAQGTVNSTLTIGGGTLIVNSPSGPGGGSFVLGNNSSATGFSASGMFVVSGGIASVNCDITRGTATGGSLLDMEGGTLDMLGHNIGSAAIGVIVNPASGTLKNVSSINGAATLTKNSAGTFTVDGNNAWVATTINAGTVSVIGVHGGTINVNAGGTLGGNGNGITTGLMGTLNVSGGTVHPGTGAGDVGKITTSALNLHSGSLAIDLGPSHTADLVNDTGALLLGDSPASILSLSLAGSASIGSYEIIDYGSLTKNADFAITGPAYFQYALDYSTANKVFLNVSVTRGDLTGNGAIAADDLAALEGALADVPGLRIITRLRRSHPARRGGCQSRWRLQQRRCPGRNLPADSRRLANAESKCGSGPRAGHVPARGNWRTGRLGLEV